MKYQKITLGLASLTSIFAAGINYANDADNQTTTVVSSAQRNSAAEKTSATHAITSTNDKADKADKSKKAETQSKPTKAEKDEKAKKSDGSDQTIYNQYYNFLQFNLMRGAFTICG